MKKLLLIAGIIFIAYISQLGTFLYYVSPEQLNPAPTLTPTPTPKLELDREILWSLIQKWRQSEGREPFIEDTRLCEIAKERVLELKEDCSHDGLHSNDKYIVPYGIGENLVCHYTTEEDSLKGWLGSPPHAKALREFTHSCLATRDRYAVQIFSNF